MKALTSVTSDIKLTYNRKKFQFHLTTNDTRKTQRKDKSDPSLLQVPSSCIKVTTQQSIQLAT